MSIVIVVNQEITGEKQNMVVDSDDDLEEDHNAEVFHIEALMLC